MIKANANKTKLFDEASTVTMIDYHLSNSLRLSGEETNLNLKWTDSTFNKRVATKKVEFEVANKEKKTNS